MKRNGLRWGVALVAMLAVTLGLRGDERTDRRINAQLTFQSALRAGREHLQRGEYEQAVRVLETNIGYIDGNREYLVALRDAYAGHVKQLQGTNRTQELKTYQNRLAILDPAARPDRVLPQARAKVETDPSAGVRPPPPPMPVPVPEGDPFDKSNSAAPAKPTAPAAPVTNNLVAQAEEAFTSKQDEKAGELFAQAQRANPDSLASCREQWAYCRLYAVARTINRGDVAQPAALQREVREAVTLAPKLTGFGEDLLRRLDASGSAPDVAVKHTPRQNGGWAKTETANFRIFHATSEEAAEKIARIAEATRVSMTRKWFSEEPAPWTPRCDLYVHPTGQGYARATGAPATAPGHSTIKQEGGRVLERRIDLRGDDANMTVGVLPHETTHVVLAGRFGTHYVPRWADEGMAVLSEPRERVNMHLRNLPKHRQEGELFAVSQLMALNDYPEPRRVGPFYAQSVSLVDYLCRKKDAPTFARFLREALDSSYESALRRHYGYASSADLERDWKQFAFGEGAVASRSEKR